MIKKYAKGGGISTEMGKGKPVDLRMAQMDKYLKDPDLELVRGPNGKFQFRERKKYTPAAPARRPKTSDANNVPGARSGDKTPRGGGIPTPKLNRNSNAVPGARSGDKTPRGGGISTKRNPPTNPNAVPGARSGDKTPRGGGIPTLMSKRNPNAVPGARSGDRTPRGGGIPTPTRNTKTLSAFTGRKPRALDTPTEIKVPKPRIKDEDLVSPRVKRNRKIAEAALASVPVGRGALAGLKAARAEFFPANQLTQRAMSRTISRARPGEVVPPSDSLFPRFKSDTASARALRETRGFSEEARQALKRGDITRGEARTMTEGYRGGGKIKSGKVATVMREFKKGELHSGKSNKPVKNPRQAVAIALSEGRKAARRK